MAEGKKVAGPVPQALYFNVMRVTHNQREFFFDFAQTATEPGVANLLSRMVTSPGHAKAVLVALTDNVRKYETKFGEIESENPPASEIQ